MTNEQRPLPVHVAAAAEVRCIASTIRLLAGGAIKLPTNHVGMRIHFADGSNARVYRETVMAGVEPRDPCALVVQFRLRLVRNGWHRAFRWESLLNTPLFVAYSGFVSKLWVAHDQHDIYRGIYEWDGPERAEYYARCLWRVLAIGCVPSSIRYTVLPHVRRSDVLAGHGGLVIGVDRGS